MPTQMVPAEQKTKATFVATLCVLAMFQPGTFFWVGAVLVAMADIPDFTPVFHRIADAVRRIERRRKGAPR
ncbi:hypothetical protein [Bradyrhizobium australafricanum]|uniref:hypothetical protein n=1 Tax=Bradyrhizobium australafricanum TaxID=2821406 RepID=UPI001CE39B48|nr:hypothetical protein [Bradyrhizobium australafricanum]MCA6104225.1 hypothetical protein [Bradyrhizobium australafricanum]